MVTLASDVDLQSPETGAAIHRLINEQLGLPISDSIWVQGMANPGTALFSGGLELNKRPVPGTQHTTYGLVVREWHRGNADHFHSWQDDAIPKLTQDFTPPVRLAKERTLVAVDQAPKQLRFIFYRNLRLNFLGVCPSDLHVVLRDDGGRSHTVGVMDVQNGLRVMVNQGKNSCVTDVLFGLPPDVGVACNKDCFDLTTLVQVELVAPSCKSGCNTLLSSITRDGFSRRTVLMQAPFLEALNMRPIFLSSHGGWTFAQNFGWPDDSELAARTAGSNYESTLVDNRRRPLGLRADEYAYQGDILKRLGVTSIWNYFLSRRNNAQDMMNLSWKQSTKNPTRTHKIFYDVTRTWIPDNVYRFDSFEHFVKDIKALNPLLPDDFVKALFCHGVCSSDQGSMLGLSLDASFSMIRRGHVVDHLWYTHLATGDSTELRTEQLPIVTTAVTKLKELGNHYYNFSGKVAAKARAWVPPAGVAVNYRNIWPQAAKHIKVDPLTSEVRIEQWVDHVSGQRIGAWPNALAALHGITIYVPDSQSARVLIDGKETKSFSRNLRDNSGRASITIVDESTPYSLVDGVPLESGGQLRALNGKVEDITLGTDQRRDYVRVTSSGRDAAAEWLPREMAMYNITHLRVAFRKKSRNEGAFFVELEMEGKRSVVLAEKGAIEKYENASRSLLVANGSEVGGWNELVVPLTDFTWPAHSAGTLPPLPIGRVKALRFGIVGATDGNAQTDIRVFAGLRPNSNPTAPDNSKLVGGQVIGMDGKPAPSIVVKANILGTGKMISTVTDNNGYYYFFRQPVERILEIAVSRGERLCAPLRGSFLQVRKDDPEIDIALNHCQ